MKNNNNELNENKKRIIEEINESIARKEKEKELKKQQKEEEKQAIREAKRKKKEERPFIIDVLSFAGQWIIVIAILVWLGGGAGEEFVANLKGEPTYKDTVLDSELYGVTVEDACKNYLKGYDVRYFEGADNKHVVEISGNMMVYDVESKLVLQFLVNSKEVGDYTLYTSTINGTVQNALITQTIFDTICKEYSNYLDNVNLDVVDTESTVTETADVETEYTFKTNTDKKNINKNNCAELIKNAEYEAKKIGEALYNYYDTVNWSVSSSEGNDYYVDMIAESGTEMYKMKVTFVIDSKGHIRISNAVSSSLDTQDAFPMSNDELNAILEQVF